MISIGPQYIIQVINGMVKLDPKGGKMKIDTQKANIEIYRGNQKVLKNFKS